MKTTSFHVELDERVVPLFAARKRDVSARLRELAVVELFREGRLSSGKAAEILDIERIEFFALLRHLGVPFFGYDAEELRRDQAAA
jgi:predicted HTH domain antitoxin